MNKCMLFSAALPLAAAGILFAGSAPKAAAKSAPAASAPAVPKPGPEHAWLHKMDGTWASVVQDHFTPDSKPTAGIMTCKDMGGFWELCDFNSEMMGTPFFGHEILGYDSKRKKHTAVWVDSTGDFMMSMEGTASADGKATTLWGKGPDMTGKMTTYKWISDWTDDDHLTFKMWVMQGKKEALVLEIAYTRKK